MDKLDDIDVKILKELQNNSKLATKELAARVNLSPTPTFERQKRLEREGYIERYMAVVNPEKVGNGLTILCGIELKQHGKRWGDEFMAAIKDIDEIVECWNTSGNYDFLMKIYVKDMKHYQDFVLNTLGVIDSIGRLHSNFVIGVVKSNHGIPIPEPADK
ncbi:MAG: Lrp/AsnC family transcriptional regulator [Prevotella sp.]|jgi:Lrp/AsnC family leucine-responsive transcriptional regulator|nr:MULTISPECIES: Lrp/AsnC family transcriptional regulator [unclassified Prevotella]MCH3969837.1 Lrp/AsnC family transcriptional regulator [Prevotella sp.]MCH3992567.1 Lrp/AsnC family transcriptional regulator [Prevotella sp.]MCH4019252.1 Lrp/AsnC family transcriptional regulator [Prevotella sp.]MCH4099158.1 Lrp/AsnC family transcriptional regulator [Prevotella sp.]MCH4186309.1 Lrp/AsnC family transcriptional regulator [Prevotella sp.]